MTRAEPWTGAGDVRQQIVLGAPGAGHRQPSQIAKQSSPEMVTNSNSAPTQHKDDPFVLASAEEERKTLEHEVGRRITLARRKGQKGCRIPKPARIEEVDNTLFHSQKLGLSVKTGICTIPQVHPHGFRRSPVEQLWISS